MTGTSRQAHRSHWRWRWRSPRRARSLHRTVKVDLSKETVGKTPATFEPMIGTWIVAQDGPDKVIKVDGAPGSRAGQPDAAAASRTRASSTARPTKS